MARVVTFTPPARRRVHEDVAEQLRDAILDGRFPAGRRLPPERDLAAEFCVNRTSIREAIKVLEGLGLVVVRQGDGATVQPLVDASLDVLGAMIYHAGRLDGAVMNDLREVVLPLFLEMGRLALARRRPEDLVTVRALRDVIADERRDDAERVRAVRQLLVVLGDMTRNRVWQMLARRVRGFLGSAPLQAARRRLHRDPGRYVPLLDECLAGLERGREAAATAALQEMITLACEPLRAMSETSTPKRNQGVRP